MTLLGKSGAFNCSTQILHANLPEKQYSGKLHFKIKRLNFEKANMVKLSKLLTINILTIFKENIRTGHNLQKLTNFRGIVSDPVAFLKLTYFY